MLHHPNAMKHALSLFFATFCFLSYSLANGTIRGHVTDPEGKAVEFAVVTLLKAADSSLVKGAVTDNAGNFSFEEIPADTYYVSVSFTGFETRLQGPHMLSDGQTMGLDDIALSTSAAMKEVTIAAVKPLIEQKPGMMVLNVESSPVRISGTAWELLTKCPGVFIDQNSNISLRGKQGVQVYIDNRPTYLGGDALKNYLLGIPAAEIVKVEIISNPTARYDAEGTAGILNLITKKGARQGFNASARLAYTYGIMSKYYSGFSFNYAREKYNIYGNLSVNQRYDYNRIRIDRTVPYNGQTTIFSQYSKMIDNSPSNVGRFGIDFTPKENISYGFRVEGYYAPEKTYVDNNTEIGTQGNDSAFTLHQQNYLNMNSANGGGGVYYRQQFDSLGRELSVSADYLVFANRNDQKYNLHFYDMAGLESTAPSFQRSNSNTDINIYVLKADYTHPFKERYKFETGIKSSYVKTDNGLAFETMQQNTWVNDTGRSNQFIYKEDINAAYVNFSASFKKLEIMAGLRAEHTISDGNSPTTGQHLQRQYLQFFPSIFITHKINEKNAISYSYSRRINRPDYENLNPFVFYLDQYTYQSGNPFLQPEIAHNADVTYTYMDAAYLSVGFSRTRFAMQDVTRQIDSTGVTFQTTENFDNVDGMYIGLGIPVPIGEWFLMENNLSYSTSRFQSNLYGTEVNNFSAFYNLSTNLTFSLKKAWKIQVWSWYQSPLTYGIFELKSTSGTGCSVSKSLLDNKLNINLSAMDIFRKNGNRVNVDFQNQHLYLQEIPESPRFSLSVRYNFGNTKAARRSQFESGADDLKDRTGK